MNKYRSKKRLTILFAVIGLLLILCLIRSVSLVTGKGDEYYHKALAQATGSPTVVLAQPGGITDRNGTVLAASRKVYRLILDPKVMLETEENFEGTLKKTLEITSAAFGIPYEDLEQAVRDNSDLSYLRYDASRILSEEEMETYQTAVDAFQTEKAEYNKALEDKDDDETPRIKAKIAGVWFEEEYRREYPLASTFSKVIGYTTKDASEGITGLELYYDSYLRGTNGKEYSYIDSEGNAVREVTEAVNGYTLKTSLDTNVSAVMKEAIRRFMDETGGKRVALLVMDPNNGEILGMESDTEFDLNDPSDLSGLFTEEELEDPAETFLLQEAFKAHPETLEAMSKEDQLLALQQQVQMNFAVSGTYEPGSTAKSLTLAAGVEEGVIDPSETFYCDGVINVDKYKIHCHMDTLCGDLTPMEALGRSCNVCYVQIGQKIGSQIFSRFQEIFNLGQKTGIDLPGEANTAGLIYKEEDLHTTELSTCAFGQGFNVTMVQFASAYSSLVNGGYYYQPHVVTEIVDDAGNTVKKFDPVVVRRTISEETSEYMKEALRYVTTKGTATYAPTEGYTLGGKTGASEKLPRGTGKYVVSFIGAVPIENPRFLVYGVVDEPDVEDQSMSKPAQELVHYCLEGLYSYFNVYPESEDDAYTYDWSTLKDSTQDSESAGGESFIEDPDQEIDWLEQIAE